MNDEQHKPENEAVELTPAEIKDTIQVLMKDSKQAIVSIEANRKTTFDLDKKMVRVYKDLDDPRSAWDRKTTRELALIAYTQSRGFLSTQTLADHKIIKDLGEELDKYVGQANLKFGQLRRQIDTIPSPDNMQDLLNSNWDFKEVKNKNEELEGVQRIAYKERESLEKQIKTINTERKEADHPTRAEFDKLQDLVLKVTYNLNDLVHFLIGYTSRESDDLTKQFLRTFLIKPLKEVSDSEESQGNNSKSE